MVGLTHGMQYCNHECWCDRAPAGKVPNASLTSECPNPPLVFCCVTVTFQICTVTGITTTRCHSTNKQSNMGETQNILARKRNCSFWTLKQNNVESNLSASWIKKKNILEKIPKGLKDVRVFFFWPPKIMVASQMLRFPFVLYYFKKWLSYYACPWRFMIFVVGFVMKINFIWNDQNIMMITYGRVSPGFLGMMVYQFQKHNTVLTEHLYVCYGRVWAVPLFHPVT